MLADNDNDDESRKESIKVGVFPQYNVFLIGLSNPHKVVMVAEGHVFEPCNCLWEQDRQSVTPPSTGRYENLPVRPCSADWKSRRTSQSPFYCLVEVTVESTYRSQSLDIL